MSSFARGSFIAATVVGFAMMLGACSVQNENMTLNDPPATSDSVASAERPEASSPRDGYPEWSYDAPNYTQTIADSRPESAEPTETLLHYFTNQKTVMIRRPSSFARDGDAQVSVWWTDNNGFHWHNAGVFGRDQSYFPLVVEEDGEYGVRFVGPGEPSALHALPFPQRLYHVDTAAPAVELDIDPRRTTYDAGQTITIMWRAEDENLLDRAVRIGLLTGVSADETSTTELQRDLDDVGSITFTIPRSMIGASFRVRADALDRAGNLGFAYSRSLTIVDRDEPAPLVASADDSFTPTDDTEGAMPETYVLAPPNGDEVANLAMVDDDEFNDEDCPPTEMFAEDEMPVDVLASVDQSDPVGDSAGGVDSPAVAASEPDNTLAEDEMNNAVVAAEDTHTAPTAEALGSTDPVVSADLVVQADRTSAEPNDEIETDKASRNDPVPATRQRERWAATLQRITTSFQSAADRLADHIVAMTDRAKSTGHDPEPIGPTALASVETPASPIGTSARPLESAVAMHDTAPQTYEAPTPEIVSAATADEAYTDTPLVDSDDCRAEDVAIEMARYSPPARLAWPETRAFDPTLGSGLVTPMPATVLASELPDVDATVHPWRALGDDLGGHLANVWSLPDPRFNSELHRLFEGQYAADSAARPPVGVSTGSLSTALRSRDVLGGGTPMLGEP